jgi:cytidine deaminase
MSALDPEDAKILTLARAAQQRAYAPHTGEGEGAAVRDHEGRTYAAATVEHADARLTTTAVRAAIAAAASSGARSIEAVAIGTPRGVACADDVSIVAEFGHDAAVFVADLAGRVQREFVVGDVLGAPDIA